MRYKLTIWDSDAKEEFSLPSDGSTVPDRDAAALAGARWALVYPLDIVMLVEVPE